MPLNRCKASDQAFQHERERVLRLRFQKIVKRAIGVCFLPTIEEFRGREIFPVGGVDTIEAGPWAVVLCVFVPLRLCVF